jgi:predicted nucleic acid-binding protein
VIYVDSSVLLAELLAENRRPPEAIWREPLTSSRLLAYEVWNRVHVRGLPRPHHAAARNLLGRVDLIELSQIVLARARQPFPMHVRTLDALHLAQALFMHRQSPLHLATYDRRLGDAAEALGIPLLDLRP